MVTPPEVGPENWERFVYDNDAVDRRGFQLFWVTELVSWLIGCVALFRVSDEEYAKNLALVKAAIANQEARKAIETVAKLGDRYALVEYVCSL